MRKYKILMLRSSGFYGGPERQIHQHALASRGSAYEIIIGAFALPGEYPDLIRKAEEDGLETQLFVVGSNYSPVAIARLRRFLVDSGIDIVASHDYRASLIAFLAVKGTRCHWLAWSRGWTYEGFKIQIFQFLEKIFVRFAERVLVVARAQKEKLRRWLVPDRLFVVIHNAVDPGRLGNSDAVDLRQRFSLPDESIVVVTAGRFSAEKGQQVLLRAVDRIIAANPCVYLIMFGDGPQLEQTRARAAELEAGAHVFCPGFEPNIIGNIRGADILVNPSLTEGLPNVVLEAMALGIPVVATEVGGVPELIRHRHDGLLVSPDDPSALAAAVLELAADSHLREQFALAGLDTVRQDFSFAAQNRKLHEVYADVIGV